MIDWEEIHNFSAREFDSPDLKGSGDRMEKDFIVKLQKAREIANIPFKVNSGYRTPEHNKKVGGVRNSSHLYGFAADIKANTNYKRIRIVIGAISAGIYRIGVARSFIHLDSDPHKSPSLWLFNTSGVLTKIFNKITNNNPEDY